MVGNTLKSTGLRMNSATIMTITESMISVTINRSSRSPGRGVINAIRIPSTASGTPNSRRLAANSPEKAPGPETEMILLCPKVCCLSCYPGIRPGISR